MRWKTKPSSVGGRHVLWTTGTRRGHFLERVLPLTHQVQSLCHHPRLWVITFAPGLLSLSYLQAWGSGTEKRLFTPPMFFPLANLTFLQSSPSPSGGRGGISDCFLITKWRGINNTMQKLKKKIKAEGEEWREKRKDSRLLFSSWYYYLWQSPRSIFLHNLQDS